MIHCTPLGICSWEFRLHGDDFDAIVELDLFTEQGHVEIDGTRFEVVKHGITSGRWTLENGTEPLATAQKVDPIRRTFDLDTPSGPLELSAPSALERALVLRRGSDQIASIAPDHAFTRRSKITQTGEIDAPTLAFVFWLTAMTWKRAASSGGGGGG